MTNTNKKAIELYLIGGFLGAGKTSFLRHLMLQLDDFKLGLLVNEFGTASIDAPLLLTDEISLIEINGGSVFCSCLAHGFTKTMKAFSETPIDILLIESSGTADPSSMNKILADLKPYLDRPYDYRGLITLVDATSFLDYVDVLLPLQNQIAAADLILVNKTDLVDGETLEEIHREIGEYQDEAPIYDTVFGSINLNELRASLRDHGRTSPSYNTPHNRPETWSLRIKGKQTVSMMEDFSRALADDSWRVKGFVKAEDDTWLHVDSCAHHIQVKPFDNEKLESTFGNGRLVIIGGQQPDDNLRKKIISAWQQTAAGGIDVVY